MSGWAIVVVPAVPWVIAAAWFWLERRACDRRLDELDAEYRRRWPDAPPLPPRWP